MTTTQTLKEVPSYSERMDSFPDVNEELDKYTEEQKKNWTKYFKMMNALHRGRQYRVRVNSWGSPEPHRADGSPLTKPSRASRIEASHKKSKAARLARRNNR